jgi:N-acetylneuraminic acid mutarotase
VDGQIYERSAITRWFEQHDTSPNTGAVLASKALVELPTVRSLVLQLVGATSLPEDEVKEWLLRKGMWASQFADRAQAKDLLSRALGMGSVEAGYHYGRVLIQDAADAGMAEAVSSVRRLEGGSSAGASAGAKLYVVGGYAGGDAGYATAVQCFDPATQEWTDVPNMTRSSSSAVAAILGGKLYLAGGRCGADMEQFHTAMDCFDSATSVWTVAPDLGTPRVCAAAAVLDGKFYVAGGFDSADDDLGSVKCFDPTTQAWTAVPPMRQKRYNAAAAALGGKLYVVGGRNDDDGVLSTVECFDPSTQAWSAAPSPMGMARYGAVAAALDGKLYVISGEDGEGNVLRGGECFDSATQTWSAVSDLSTPHMFGVAAALDGKLYVAGGQDRHTRDLRSPHSIVECFDPATQTWSRTPSMVRGTRYAASAYWVLA